MNATISAPSERTAGHAERTASQPWLALVLGVCCVAATTVLKLAFRESIGEPTPFLLYFAAVLLAAAIGGLGVGLVVTAVSVSFGYIVFFDDSHASDAVVASAAFVIEAAGISYLASRIAQERHRSSEATVNSRLALEQLELVLSAVDDGITVQDAGGRLIYANDAAARFTGYPSARALVDAPPQDIAERFEILTPGGDPFPCDRLPGRVLLRGGRTLPELVQFRDRRSGRRGWSQIRARAIRDEISGRVLRVVNVMHDVTEDRRRAQALQVSREWFSTALRSIGDAVIATDQAGTITFLNPIAEQLTGWTGAEAEGRPLADVFRIVDGHDRSPAVSPVDTVIQPGVIGGLANHTILLRRDGTEVPIDDSAAPIRRGDGELVGVVLVFRDVTAQRREQTRTAFLAQASAELNASLDYEITLTKVAQLAVPHIADWCAVDVLENGECRRIAVAHVDPAKVELVRELDRLYPTDPDATHGVPQILRSGRAELATDIPEAAFATEARDDEHLRLLLSLELRSYIGVPLARGGKAFGAITLAMAESGRSYDREDLGFATALADRASIAIENARLFAGAEKARADAERADRTKDEFLAMLGHELRNPLAPISSALDLLASGSPATVMRAHKVIDRQVQHLVRLVDDLLDVSRITRGRIEIEREPVELAEIALKALEIASPLLQQRRHTVVTSVPGGLFVPGDAVRLAQVLTNLLTNAAKYTEPGGHIWIDAERDGSWIDVSVRDDGIGIAPEMLSRIFELFVQEPQSIDRAQGGLGLGLSIVQSLVSLHGGVIAAQSAGPGKGSEFMVRLPSCMPGLSAKPPAEPVPCSAKSSARVLVVDDNEDARDLLAEVLRTLGHEVHTADHPFRALELAATVRPTIALLDIGLPEIDGYELGRRLREIDGLAAIKLVAITGYGQESDRMRSAETGFDEHLVKPVRIEQITAVIDGLAL